MHPAIENLLNNYTSGCINILGDNLVGIYLSGSLSYGDFEPGRSDIDLFVITSDNLSDKQFEKLDDLHKEIFKKYPNWKNRIEISYTPLSLLNEIDPPKESRPYLGAGVFHREATYGNEWLINNYQIRESGRTLYGIDYKELIDPIPMELIVEACRKDFEKEWLPLLKDDSKLQDPHIQSYVVLNICRILYTIKNHELASKKKSSDWVKKNYSEWDKLIEEAYLWENGAKMNEVDNVKDFINWAQLLIT